MKKVITIMCLAAAPILFAQEKSLKASTKENVQVEQQNKKEIKAQEKEAKKKIEAEQKASKTQVKAIANKNEVYKNSLNTQQTTERKKKK